MTVVELLVALAVALVVVVAAVAITFANRKAYDLDQARTSLNQNLRTGLSIVGDDTQVAGERLSSSTTAYLPPIEVIGGTELVLRRNLLDQVLPFCDKKIQAGSSQNNVTVSLKPTDPNMKSGANPQCTIAPDNNGDGWPDNLEAWKDFRVAHGGQARAFIVTPLTGASEFFTYDSEDASTFHIHRLAGKWQNTYQLADKPQLYMLEEKRYLLSGGYLELILDGDTSSAQRIIPNVTDFQVRAVLNDGTVRTDFPQSGDTFSDLRAIRITVAGTVAQGRQSASRTLQAQFFPRNVLSQ